MWQSKGRKETDELEEFCTRAETKKDSNPRVCVCVFVCGRRRERKKERGEEERVLAGRWRGEECPALAPRVE